MIQRAIKDVVSRNRIDFINKNTIPGLESWREKLLSLDDGEEIILKANLFGNSLTAGSGAGTTLSDVYSLSTAGRIRTYFKNLYNDVGEGIRMPYWWYRTDHTYNTYAGTWGVQGDQGFGNIATSTTNGDTITIPFIGTGIRIYYYTGSSSLFGDFTTSIDGDTPVSRSSAGTVNYCNYFDITGYEDGNHSLVITKTDEKRFWFIGSKELNSATKGVEVNNLGVVGNSAYLNYDPTSNPNFYSNIAKIQSDLSIIEIGINDKLTNVTIGNFTTAVNNCVDACKNAGADVMIVISGTTSTSGTYPWSDYVNALYSIAESRGCAVVDFSLLWGGYRGSLAGSIATYTTDGIHPTANGHLSRANYILSKIGL